MLRVLTLTTLFPNTNRPRLGCFVERQTLGLAAHPDVDLRIVSPVGLPPWPLSRHPHYRGSASLPAEEMWHGVPLYRPRFVHLPGMQGRFDAGAMTRSLIPLLETVRRDFAFDVIDAEYFFPDGPAAVVLGRHFGVPVSIKARGSDIHVWGRGPATAAQVTAAGQAADGLLAVSNPLKDDMVALGMPADRITVHYTGVDRGLFTAQTREQARHTIGIAGPLVICAGTLSARKGQSVLIEALKDLPDVTPRRRWP
jgi:teichuronic acid biosynthesis glycosyltransferase TuaC